MYIYTHACLQTRIYYICTFGLLYNYIVLHFLSYLMGALKSPCSASSSQFCFKSKGF